MTPLYPSKTKSPACSSSEWKSTPSSTSITVGTMRRVSVKVESCFGSQPIWITRLPRCAKAADRLDDVVDLPMPPFP